MIFLTFFFCESWFRFIDKILPGIAFVVDSSSGFFGKDGEHRARIYKYTIVNFNVAYLSHIGYEDKYVNLLNVCSIRSFLQMPYNCYL